MRKGNMRKYGMKKWAVILGAAAAMETMWFGTTAMAAGGSAFGGKTGRPVIAGEWINMELGPGVAQWVDENGNVTEEPGIKPGMEQDGGQTGQNQGNAADSAEAGGPADGGQSVNGQDMAGQGTDGTETSQGTETPGQSQNGRVIDPDKPMVALTFDDGPFAPVGNRILDCLAQYGGKATFYVVGNRCASYKEEMQRMAAEGHEIGNHTYGHKYLNKLGAAEIQSQVQKGNEAIQAAAGVGAATVRLPGGNKNATVLANVNAPMIMWSIDTLDWKTKNAQNTVDAVLGKVKDGDIVLMHELYQASGDAALQIIPALTERGYQLVTVSEMAQYRGGLENGKVYYNFYR